MKRRSLLKALVSAPVAAVVVAKCVPVDTPEPKAFAKEDFEFGPGAFAVDRQPSTLMEAMRRTADQLAAQHTQKPQTLWLSPQEYAKYKELCRDLG